MTMIMIRMFVVALHRPGATHNHRITNNRYVNRGIQETMNLGAVIQRVCVSLAYVPLAVFPVLSSIVG